MDKFFLCIGNSNLKDGSEAQRTKNRKTVATSFRLSASGFWLSAFGFQLSASCIRETASGFQLPASCIRETAFGFRLSASCIREKAFGFQLPASCIRETASGFQLSASCIREKAFGFRLSASCIREKASGFQLPASCIRETASGFQLPANGPKAVSRKPAADSRKPKTLKQLLIVLSILLATVACNQKTFDSKKALYSYLKNPENGYTQHKFVNGIDYTITYKPTDLMVQQELDTVTKDRIQSLRNKYGNYLYFTLQFSRNGKALLSNAANRQEFGRLVNQLAFGMANKVHLYTEKKDTLNLLDYHYPRLYGMSPSTSMLFVYPREIEQLASDYLVLSIEDFGLQTEDLKFKFDTNKIKKEPKLEF